MLRDDHELIYQTPTYRIGHHEWRISVRKHPSYGPCTYYEFRQVQFGPKRFGIVDLGAPWQDQREWPTYNDNASDGGLPKSVRKIWDRHKSEIRNALGSSKLEV